MHPIKPINEPKDPRDKIASRWVRPIKNPRVDTVFCDYAYWSGQYGAALKGYWHTGIDLNNASTSGNQDVGYGVYACSNGIVEYVAYRNAGGSWGPMVVIKHVLSSGRTVWTRYAHLQNVKVKRGEYVKTAQRIGEIGLPKRWGQSFPGHLHFDVIKKRLPRYSHWPRRHGAKYEVTKYYENPLTFLVSVKADNPTWP